MGEIESVFRAVADERRRLALDCVTEHRLLTLPDLAEEVTERETGESVAELPPEKIAETYFSLYHNHVPKLERAGLVRYEQEDDLVVQADGAVGTLAEARDELATILDEERLE